MGTVLLTLAIFLFMITLHELGHFTVARLCGVKINEFSLGMGPKLLQKQGPETKYTLRLLPIGGYVSMEGEDERSEDECAFCNQKAWKRFLIVVGGAVMNLLLGFVLLLSVSLPRETLPSNTISEFKEDAVSVQSGLQEGDTLLKINGTTIFTDTDIISSLLDSDSSSMVIEVRRNGERVRLPEVTFLTEPSEEGAPDQLYIDFYVQSMENNLWQSMVYSLKSGCTLARLIWISVLDLVTGTVGFSQLSGPIGVGEAIGQAASYGISSLLLMCAFLTINLGVFNLLPLPALDGGRLVFIAIEMIFRRPVLKKYEGWIHGVGIVLLFGLMIVVMIKDIYKLF